MHAFDRETDRQRDTFLIASPRWHSMQRGKMNVSSARLDTVTTNNNPLFLHTAKSEVCLTDFPKNPHYSDCVSTQEMLTDKRKQFFGQFVMLGFYSNN